MIQLLTLRWIIAHLVVIALAVTFINLGFWQLDRHDQKQLENTVGQARYDEPTASMEVIVPAAGSDIESLEYRRAIATGTFDAQNEVLVRSQVYLGTAGFHVITPLIAENGNAVLVNRGWVPLLLDTVPVTQATPPDGEVTVEGWIHLTQTKGALSPADPESGEVQVMSRVDIERISDQTPYPLLPVYLVAIGDRGEDLPFPIDQPVFDANGPHLAYAIQWFAFTVIGLVGYSFLIKRSVGLRP